MRDTLIGVYSCSKNISRVEHIERLKMYEGVDQYYIISKHDLTFSYENKIVVYEGELMIFNGTWPDFIRFANKTEEETA